MNEKLIKKIDELADKYYREDELCLSDLVSMLEEYEANREHCLPKHETVEETMRWLIDDIKTLPMADVFKIYKYVRRYCVANIEGLIDPLEKPE